MVARGFYAEVVVMEIGSFVCLSLLISILLSQRFQPLDAHPRIRNADRLIALITLFAVLLQTARGVDASGAFGIYEPAVQHLLHAQTTAVICQVVTVILIATLRTLYVLLKKPVPPFVVPGVITASLAYYLAVAATNIAEFFVNTSTASDMDMYVYLFVRNILLMGYVTFAIAGSFYLLFEIRASLKVVILQLNDAQIRQAKQMASEAEHLIHGSQGATHSNNSLIHLKVSSSPVTTPPNPNRTLAFIPSPNPEVVPMLTAEAVETTEEKKTLPPVVTIHPVPVESPSSASKTPPTNYVGEVHSNSAKIMELKMAVRRLFLFLICVDTIGAGGVFVTMHQNVQYIQGHVNLDDYMLRSFDTYPGFRLVAFIFHMGVFAVIIWSAYLPSSIWMNSPFPFWKTLRHGPPAIDPDGSTKRVSPVVPPQMRRVQQQPAQHHLHEQNGQFIRVPIDALSPQDHFDGKEPDASVLPSKMSSLQLGPPPMLKKARPMINPAAAAAAAARIEESSMCTALPIHIPPPQEDGNNTNKAGERDRHRLTIGKLRANLPDAPEMETTQTLQVLRPPSPMDRGNEFVEASPDTVASALLAASNH